MRGFHLTANAQSDLIAIRDYTQKHWGNQQSLKYIIGLRQTIELLAETPSIGKERLEISANAFSFPHQSHVIYYLFLKQQLIVFGILHKNMIPSKHLENRENVFE